MKMIKNKILSSWFILCVFLASCAGSIPSVETLEIYEKTEQSKQNSNDSYVIGPSDILAINLWKEPELSIQTAVRLDGKISLPLVNDIKAAGLSCAALRSQLIENYKDYVEVPEVSVTLVESRSKKIYILGKINNPGEYTLQKNMTIVQALSLAGGLDQWADPSDVRLIRKIKGIEKTFRVNYNAIISGKDLSQNIQLQSDDTLFLP
jgi:polysaccharide export outer membrane protein